MGAFALAAVGCVSRSPVSMLSKSIPSTSSPAGALAAEEAGTAAFRWESPAERGLVVAEDDEEEAAAAAWPLMAPPNLLDSLEVKEVEVEDVWLVLEDASAAAMEPPPMRADVLLLVGFASAGGGFGLGGGLEPPVRKEEFLLAPPAAADGAARPPPTRDLWPLSELRLSRLPWRLEESFAKLAWPEGTLTLLERLPKGELLTPSLSLLLASSVTSELLLPPPKISLAALDTDAAETFLAASFCDAAAAGLLGGRRGFLCLEEVLWKKRGQRRKFLRFTSGKFPHGYGTTKTNLWHPPRRSWRMKPMSLPCCRLHRRSGEAPA